MSTKREMDWHFTSEMLPQYTVLYIVTPAQDSRVTEPRAFIAQLEDWDFGGDESQYVDDDGNILVFPLWIDPRAWFDENGGIYPDEFHWYVEQDPYAWIELPTPCNDDDPCTEEESKSMNLEMDSLDDLW